MRMRPDFKNFDQQPPRDGLPPRVHPVDTIVDEDRRRGLINIPVATIHPNPNQPRRHFDQQALDELTASVKEHGILQPIIVRKHPDTDGYMVVVGERRWRAAQAAGLPKMPALVRDAEDHLEIAIIENLQRQNLNPVEEAEAFLKLKTTRGYTDERLAQVVGKSRQAVNDSLLLTQLPEDIKEECRTSGTATKSQLLSVLRAGNEEKVRATWQALSSGELPTVRALRKHNKKTNIGRPKNFTFQHGDPAKGYRITISFKKPKVTQEELRQALTEALESLS